MTKSAISFAIFSDLNKSVRSEADCFIWDWIRRRSYLCMKLIASHLKLNVRLDYVNRLEMAFIAVK